MGGGPRNRTVKIGVVGDAAVGKTCLLHVTVSGVFPDGYVPTVFDNHSKTVEINGESINLSLWDTAGHESYARLRQQFYQQMETVVVCFAANDRQSFINVEKVWVPEVQTSLPNQPYVLCCSKSDLRTDDSAKTIQHDEGVALAKRIGAAAYFECSALKHPADVQSVFETLARAYLAVNDLETDAPTRHPPQPGRPLPKRMRSAGTGPDAAPSSRTARTKSHSKDGLQPAASAAGAHALAGKESCAIQ